MITKQSKTKIHVLESIDEDIAVIDEIDDLTHSHSSKTNLSKNSQKTDETDSGKLHNLIKNILRIEGDYESEERQYNYVKSMISGMLLSFLVGIPHFLCYFIFDYFFGLIVGIIGIFLFFIHILNCLLYYFLPRTELIHNILVHTQNYFTSCITNSLIILCGGIRLTPSFFIMVIYLTKNYGLNAKWKKLYKIYMYLSILVVLIVEVFRTIFYEFKNGNTQYVLERNEYICVLFLKYLFVLGVMLVLGSHIPRYFNQYSDILEKIYVISDAISQLDFERDELQHLISVSGKKCSKVMLSLKNIILNVRQYKDYLPDRLIQEVQFDDDNSDCSSLGSLESGIVDIPSRLMERRSSNSSNRGARNKISCGIEIKSGVVVYIKILNFRELVLESFDGYIKIFNEFSDCVKQVVLFYRGIIEKSENDYIKCSFNIYKNIVKYEIVACKACLKIVKKTEKQFSDLKIGICIMKDDEVISGNIGNNIKCSLTWSERFDKSTKILNYGNEANENCIFIDDKVKSIVKYETNGFYFDRIPFKKDFIRVHLLDSVVKDTLDKEWIYVVNTEELRNEYGDFDKAAEFYFKGEYEEAKKEIMVYIEKISKREEDPRFCVERLKNLILSKTNIEQKERIHDFKHL